jgi:hypothetical protein
MSLLDWRDWLAIVAAAIVIVGGGYCVFAVLKHGSPYR